VNRIAFGGPQEAELVDALRAAGKAVISLVAVDGEEVIGHILFSPVSIGDATAVRALGLAPMSVLPQHQNAGIGSSLVRAGLEECSKLGYECVVVLGHATYYPRFGFIPASRFGLRSEYAVPDEVFMATELREGALKECAGLVRYASEFADIED